MSEQILREHTEYLTKIIQATEYQQMEDDDTGGEYSYQMLGRANAYIAEYEQKHGKTPRPTAMQAFHELQETRKAQREQMVSSKAAVKQHEGSQVSVFTTYCTGNADV